ncbi:MAG: hypothetical protein JNK72_12900 [Myxococcales bacterium]|nr:hypothetical protein [Myxococcales bacterium]
MRKTAPWIALVVASLMACETIAPLPASRCVAPAGASRASPEAVCGRLTTLGCGLDNCPEAYARFAAQTAPASFDRLTACYVAASSCDEVDQCARACGDDGGAVQPLGDAALDAVRVDGSSADAEPLDGFAADGPEASVVDAGAVDAGAVDAGAVDAGALDAGAVDATPGGGDAEPPQG